MFQGWTSYYQMTGGASATLVALLFVVATLTESREPSQVLRAVSIYLTPTALHFGIVLAISGLALVPRLSSAAIAGLMGFGAVVGLGNGLWACLGMRRRSPGADPPHWSDFWLYGAAPSAIYLALGGVSVALWAGAAWGPYAVAALLLALLLLGVRNAWDLVTWIASRRGRPPQ